MGGAFKIATVRGVDIKVHWSFALILLYGAWIFGEIAARNSAGDARALVAGGLYGVLIMLVLFFFVVLHELGHSIAAQHYKIPVTDITLLPLGGVARIERMPENPRQEFIIAIAGPAVNFALTLILAPLLAVALGLEMMDGAAFSLDPSRLSVTGFLSYMVVANVFLALFNLLPAFPMDGGRIFRALLAMATDYQKATQAAVVVGRGLAVLLGLWGFVSGNFLLLLIAVFIYVGAGQEGNEVMVRNALRGVCVREAYNKRALALGAGQRVSEVVDLMLTSYQTDFAVMVGSQLVGVVTRDRVVAALRAAQGDVPVSEIMTREVLRVPPDISLYEVRRQMAERGTRVAAVFDGPIYLGLVSLEDISEAFLLLAATPKERPVGPSKDTTSKNFGPQ